MNEKTTNSNQQTISEYIIQELIKLECKHLIGIPGTNCAPFYNTIDRTEGMEYIIPTSELEVGYIADGYARNGQIAAICVAYGVGTLSLTNPLAGAYAEKLPMILINGGPTTEDEAIESKYGSLFLHSTGVEANDYKVFKNITAFATVIKHPAEAKQMIDEALKIAIEKSQPVYLEVPSDFWDLPIHSDPQRGDADYFLSELKTVVVNKLQEKFINKNSFEKAKVMSEVINDPFKDVVLIVGAEVIRKNISKEVLALIRLLKIPFVTTPLSKSFESEFEGSFEMQKDDKEESHRTFVNAGGLLYKGCLDTISFLDKDLKITLEKAQYFLSVGNVWGIDNKKFIVDNYSKMIEVGYNQGRIGYKTFENLGDLKTVFNEIGKAITSVNVIEISEKFLKDSVQHNPQENTLTHDELHKTVEEFVSSTTCPEILFNVDACLAMFWGTEIKLNKGSQYISNPSWLSIGHSAPASIGHYLKNKKAPLIITGDGGFQMVSQTYSTMVKLGVPALIIVMNNSVLGIEEYLLDPKSKRNEPLNYAKVSPWNYEAFPQIYNADQSFGVKCTSTESLAKTLADWAAYINNGTDAKQPWIVNCVVDTMSIPKRINQSNIEKSKSLISMYILR